MNDTFVVCVAGQSHNVLTLYLMCGGIMASYGLGEIFECCSESSGRFQGSGICSRYSISNITVMQC